ncbi:TetR/AcrR family transcriptional regulator [Rhodoferax sp.]|uniref:TetR/AcrR family transcriptional regulator n=1 Tax=Rhodoferax sp. TaxID=50421 RepID=UPI00374D078E
MPAPSSTPDAQAKRARRKESRPGELLAAALDLFVEKGFAATRVEEVAQRAGVSKGTLFLYFSSKEELFKAVVRQSLSGRFQEWSDEVDRCTGSSADLLRYGMTSWWERVGNTNASGITKLMLCEAHNFPEMAAFYQAEVAEPYHLLVRRILQRGLDSGEFADTDIDLATYSVTAPLIFLAMWKHSPSTHPCTTEAFDPEKYIAAQVHIILNGLRARAPADPRPP